MTHVRASPVLAALGGRMATKSLASRRSSTVDGWASGHLPSSGCLLGVLVETCELRHESEYLQGSTAQRWFRGETIRPSNQERIIGEVARSVRASFGESAVLGSEELLTCTAAAWDGVRGTASSAASFLESSGGPWSIPVLIMRGFVTAGALGCLAVIHQDPPSTRGGGVGAYSGRSGHPDRGTWASVPSHLGNGSEATSVSGWVDMVRSWC